MKILTKNNLSGNEISLFIPHQANKRIIDAAAQKCGIEESKVLINIDLRYTLIFSKFLFLLEYKIEISF